MTGDKRRCAVLAALVVVPWSIQLLGGGVGLRFAWGMVTLDPLAGSLLTDYGRFLRSPQVFPWVLATVSYLLAGALACVPASARALAATGVPIPASVLTPERVAARDRLLVGLLAIAGVANALVDWTFSVQPGRVALPVGSLLLWTLAWRWWAHSPPDSP